jgi:hypothetical protein
MQPAPYANPSVPSDQTKPICKEGKSLNLSLQSRKIYSHQASIHDSLSGTLAASLQSFYITATGEVDMQLQHLLGIETLHPQKITEILDLADQYADRNRSSSRNSNILAGCTQINMFFENSTRTQASFEIAGKRLGADVMNMPMQASSIKKGETLIDTALTLNAMHPDLLVVRHPHSGAVDLLAQKVNCAA